MKLAGITWWRNNYGSILQAYALQQTLINLSDIEYEIINQYGRRILSSDNLIDKLKRIGLRKTIWRAFWKIGIKGLRNRNRNIQRFIDEKLNISAEQYTNETIHRANERYDGFVCGSDQIWNPMLTDNYSIYWLGFADNAKLKISYAPSIGVESLTSEQKKIIKKNLSSFQAVSCRENKGTELINKIFDGEQKCITVLDPTLLVERTLWDNLCSKRKYEGSYIFVYMLRGTKKQYQLIQKYAKNKRLKIVTMPFLDSEYIKWYDLFFGNKKLWDASPTEFISVIRYAEYVITDSFHCMVFSCLYHKPFFTFPKIGKAQLSRLTGLQELFHIPSRMINETDTVETFESMEEINWSVVEKILEEKRMISQDYLKKAVLR